MPRKRLLISINSSWNVYNFRAGLVCTLIEGGYEVLAATPPDGYSSKLRSLGCHHIPFPMDTNGRSAVRDSALFLRYLRLLRRLRPDVFLGFTIKPNIYGSIAAHLLGIPVINNVTGLGTMFVGETWLTKLVKLLYSVALRSSKTVLFQNPDDRSLFIRSGLVEAKRAGLVPGSGVDLSRFRPQTPSPPPGRSSAAVFLLIGRLLWEKGVGQYVEAARLVRQRFPETRFQVLGFLDAANRGAISRAQMDAWVNEGIVEYLGSTGDVRPAISAASCVVLPSYYPEGTPRVLLEAAAMGKPLVATNTPGCKNTVSHGVNGFLCAPRDHADLAGKLIAFLSLDRMAQELMGAASRLKAEKEFDERIVFRRYLAAIEDALGGDARHLRAEVEPLGEYTMG